MKQLFLTALLLALPLLASAYDCQVNGIYYNLIPKGNVAEVTYKSKDQNGTIQSDYSGTITIPEKFTYEGVEYSVTTIGEHAFYGCSRLTSVTIPNSINSIGDGAFQNCTGLTSVELPNSVTTIGGGVFYGCSGLTSVTIPNSVTTIRDYAFYGCSGLTSVTIPNSVTTIESWAFQNCSGLTSVVIPNSVTSIGNYAFKDCSSLISVTIPNSVTSIGNYAFSSCRGITSVHITDLEAWCKITFRTSDSNPLSYAHHLYLNGEEIRKLVIPNTVTYIGKNTFQSCTALTSVTIPNSVTSIGGSAFQYCSGLTSVTIPNSVTSIGDLAFSGCSGLTSVTIPNSVTSIGKMAFSDCSGMASVTIPNSVTYIGEQTFANCSKLEEVCCLAKNVPWTGTNAFEKSYPEYMTLYVPASALNAYTTTVPWSEFGIILPLPDETGIENVKKQKTEITDRYIPDGKRVDTPKKGLNIIRMSDGTVKKVVVK